jgi:hypothetical protein
MGAIGVVVIVAILTGWVTTIKNIVVLGTKGNDMVALAKRTPYAPAAGACLSEAQLNAYLEVCRRVKPAADKVDAWEEASRPAGRAGTPRFKGGAAGLVADYLRELKAAMDDQGIGPSEFAWISTRIERVVTRSPVPDECGQPERALCIREAERIRTTRLGEHARRIAFGFAEN